MLYDLNVPWAATQNPLELQRTIAFLSELGYHTIALNHTLFGAIPPQIINPIPETQPFAIPTSTTLLRRCTLHISDPAQNYRMPNLAAVYDILALRPTTEKAFLAACGKDLSEHSIISLDLTIRQPFFFKPVPLMTAVKRGVKIEICYAQATMEGLSARRYFISNVLEIIRATKGRGLILSSEAKSALGVRAPADVVNLMDVWGLGRERAAESLGVNPRGVVINEGIKRTSFRGVVDVIYGGERAIDQTEVTKRTAQDDIAPKGKKAKKKEARKSTVEQSPAGSPGPIESALKHHGMSKTQAKKQKFKELRDANRNTTSTSLPSSPKDGLGTYDKNSNSKGASVNG
jgi:ribonuclease P/MRP protein subunit RPP1